MIKIFFYGVVCAVLFSPYVLLGQIKREDLLSSFDDATYFSEGRIAVKKGNKWGFADEKGNIVIPAIYDAVSFFSEGLAAVRTGDVYKSKYGFIDKTGKLMIPLQYDYAGKFSEGLAPVAKASQYGFIDKTGKQVVDFIYDRASDFSEGLALVEKNKKMGMVDKKGNLVFPTIYQSIQIRYNDIILKKMGEDAQMVPKQQLTKYAVESYINHQLDQMNTAKQKELTQWQRKTEFEKNAEYQKRMEGLPQKIGEASDYIQSQRKAVTQEAYNYFAKSFDQSVDWTNLQLQTYDADNETFKIGMDKKVELIASVPMAWANTFKKNITKMKIVDKDFVLKQKGWVLSKAKLDVPGIPFSIYVDEEKTIGYDPTQTTPIQIVVPALVVGKEELDLSPSFVYNVEDSLPQTQSRNDQTIAVIIGNKDYIKGDREPYAINDANSIKNYFLQVLNIKKENIIYKNNATLLDFNTIFGTRKQATGTLSKYTNPNSTIIVYYAGKTAVDENTQNTYFVPVDGDLQNPDISCYATSTLQTNLAKLNPNKTIVIAEAAFSVAQRSKNVPTTSGGILEIQNPLFVNNGAVMIASAKKETKATYREASHGLFTYLLLKGINRANADRDHNKQLTLQELHDYINDPVGGLPIESKRRNQTGEIQESTLDALNPNDIIVWYK